MTKTCPACQFTHGNCPDEKLCPLHETAEELLAACKEIIVDLRSGFIAQDSHRAEVNRRKLEKMLETIVGNAEGR